MALNERAELLSYSRRGARPRAARCTTRHEARRWSVEILKQLLESEWINNPPAELPTKY